MAERCELVRHTRQIARRLGRADIPITVGCNAGCTRDVIDATIAAKNAGADFSLVLISSFFHFALDNEAIVSFFREVADSSPIPVVMYNYPAVAGGLDITSDIVDALGSHPNIVGVKFTCGGIAKVARAAAAFPPEQFSVFAGQADWLVPALTVGGQGCITGLANLYPKVSTIVYQFLISFPFDRYCLTRLASSCSICTAPARSRRPRNSNSKSLLPRLGSQREASTAPSGRWPNS